MRTWPWTFVLVLSACASAHPIDDEEPRASEPSSERTSAGRDRVASGDPPEQPEGPAELRDTPSAEPPDLAMGAPRTNPGCGIATGWAGDESCIDAPDPAEGMQFHFGPSTFDDEAEVQRFVLAQGEERLSCAYLVTPNPQEIYYGDWLNSFRPGSHHMIVTLASSDVQVGAPLPCGQGGGMGRGQGLVGGNTTSVAPFPEIAPENVGLARTIPARTGIAMQLHFFNFGDEPLLMEAWQNIYFMPREEVRGFSAPIEGLAGLSMSVEPGTIEVIAGSMAAPAALRVIDLFSHNHDHTLRFSAFLRRQGESDRTLIYESYDWADPLYLPLDSIHDNGPADRTGKIAGGHTGVLELEAGDMLEWECEIHNDDLDIPLRFANEAHTAEMCILRGDYTPSIGQAWGAYLP